MAQFLVPALLGLGLFLLGWFQFRRARASRSWPAVTGRIVDAKVESETSQGDSENPDSTSFFPAIQYEYQVGAQAYRASRIAFDRKSYPKPQLASQALQAFPAGAEVLVYYDPAKPGDAVLQRTNSTGTVLMAVGGLIVVLGIAAALKR